MLVFEWRGIEVTTETRWFFEGVVIRAVSGCDMGYNWRLRELRGDLPKIL